MRSHWQANRLQLETPRPTSYIHPDESHRFHGHFRCDFVKCQHRHLRQAGFDRNTAHCRTNLRVAQDHRVSARLRLFLRLSRELLDDLLLRPQRRHRVGVVRAMIDVIVDQVFHGGSMASKPTAIRSSTYCLQIVRPSALRTYSVSTSRSFVRVEKKSPSVSRIVSRSLTGTRLAKQILHHLLQFTGLDLRRNDFLDQGRHAAA